MKSIRYISKALAVFLLLVMGQTFYCAATCTAGNDTCCNQVESEEELCENELCKEETQENKGSHDCQEDHQAFFQIIGKFFSAQNYTLVKVFHTLPIISFVQLELQDVENKISQFFTSGFHPPPPNDEIRILIHSFLI